MILVIQFRSVYMSMLYLNITQKNKYRIFYGFGVKKTPIFPHFLNVGILFLSFSTVKI